MTHFRLAPSGFPGTPTLLTTTISGARAAPRPRPRPPPACHLPPGRACGDCLAAFWRAGGARGSSPTATAPPRETKRASAAEQEGSGPRRRGAGPAFLPSGSLRSEPQPCFPQARSWLSAAAFFPSGSLFGRGLACLKLALRPPSFLQARSAAVPTPFQARSPPPPSSSQARSPAAAPQPPRLRGCSRGALLRFSSGVAAGAGR